MDEILEWRLWMRFRFEWNLGGVRGEDFGEEIDFLDVCSNIAGLDTSGLDFGD